MRGSALAALQGTDKESGGKTVSKLMCACLGSLALIRRFSPLSPPSPPPYPVSELLSFYKFPGDDIPIVRGSALAALQGGDEEIGRKAILKLMDAVDSYIPEPKRVLDKPFLMPVEDVFSIQVREKERDGDSVARTGAGMI